MECKCIDCKEEFESLTYEDICFECSTKPNKLIEQVCSECGDTFYKEKYYSLCDECSSDDLISESSGI